MTVSRDFRGRRKREAEPDRLPPGQYVAGWALVDAWDRAHESSAQRDPTAAAPE